MAPMNSPIFGARLAQTVARRTAMLLAAVVLLWPTGAASASPVVIPPSGSNGYAELSAAWWQYVLSFPATTSPFFDTTGANCALGQSRPQPVFFLTGSLDSTPVQRTQCVAPAGKALFFPMVNTVDVNTTNQTAPELRAEIAPIEAGAHNLFASIDGIAVPNPVNFRSKSAVFTLALPADNLFGLAAGRYRPVVADGYYILLSPLAKGQHTIIFGGVDGTGFSQNITYDLAVQ